MTVTTTLRESVLAERRREHPYEPVEVSEAYTAAFVRGRQGPRVSRPLTTQTIDGTARLTELAEADREYRRRYPYTPTAPVQRPQVAPAPLRSVNLSETGGLAPDASPRDTEKALAASFARLPGWTPEMAAIAARGRRAS